MFCCGLYYSVAIATGLPVGHVCRGTVISCLLFFLFFRVLPIPSRFCARLRNIYDDFTIDY